MTRRNGEDSVKEKVEEEGITWLLNKHNYSWFWTKEIEGIKSYVETNERQGGGMEDEDEEEEEEFVCGCTKEDGSICMMKGTKKT